MVAMVTGTTVELVTTVVAVVAVVTPAVLGLVAKASTLELPEDEARSLHNAVLTAAVLVATGCICTKWKREYTSTMPAQCKMANLGERTHLAWQPGGTGCYGNNSRDSSGNC